MKCSSLRLCGKDSGRSEAEGLGSRILVAGLGNLLLRDDGVGVHAIRELRRKVLKGILAVEVGTAVLDALHLFERADKLLAIDAMQAGGTPGTIYAFRLSEVEDRPARASLHEMNLLSALRLLPGHQPEVMVLGVEPEIIDYGLTLSPRVADAVPRLVEEARRVLSRWAPQHRM